MNLLRLLSSPTISALLATLLVIGCVSGCTVRVGEPILFRPTKEKDLIPRDPYVLEEVYLRSNDGLTLNGIFLDNPHSDLTILLFHGHAGSIWRPDHVEFFEDLMKTGYDVFALDYRGYGKSEGRPTLGGIYADGHAAWEYLAARGDVDHEKIVIYGHSLGTAVAVNVGEDTDPIGVILEGSFTNDKDMVRYINKRGTPRVTRPFFKLDLDRSVTLDLVEPIKGIDCPVLFLHGESDDVTPMVFAMKLFREANEPKSFVHFPGASHDDLHRVAGDEYIKTLKSFIEGLDT